jgi:hypothetical protein
LHKKTKIFLLAESEVFSWSPERAILQDCRTPETHRRSLAHPGKWRSDDRAVYGVPQLIGIRPEGANFGLDLLFHMNIYPETICQLFDKQAEFFVGSVRGGRSVDIIRPFAL